MKKVLFATTALVATAGVAAADINLTGGAIIGLKSSGVSGQDVILHQELDFNIVASGESDNGIAFGASMDIDTDNATSSTSDGEMFISGAFGKLSFGNVDFAMDAIGLGDVGFDSLAVDDTMLALRGTVQADVVYSYSIDGLTLTLSTDIGSDTANNAAGEGDFSMHVGYKAGDVSVELGYADDNSTGDTSSGVEVSYAMGAVTLGATMINLDYANAATRDLSGYGLRVGYAVNDALTVTGVYAQTEQGAAGTADHDASGIGFAYKMGGGLSLIGGAASVANVDKWDLGLSMSF